MSYILDALKRAETQRERHAAPGLLAQPATTLPPPATSGRALPMQGPLAWALLLAVLAAGALALAWQWSVFNAPPALVAPAAPVVIPATPPAMAAAAPTVVPPVLATPPIPAQATTSVAATPEKTPVLELAQLPASVRQQLPALTISGSTYSSNPAHRLLIANGQVLREGDALAPGHVLEQIQAKSAVLNYRGTRYRLPY